MKKYYYVDKNKDRKGPYSIDELKQIGINQDTLVYCKGMTTWTKAEEVPDLYHLFKRDLTQEELLSIRKEIEKNIQIQKDSRDGVVLSDIIEVTEDEDEIFRHGLIKILNAGSSPNIEIPNPDIFGTGVGCVIWFELIEDLAEEFTEEYDKLKNLSFFNELKELHHAWEFIDNNNKKTDYVTHYYGINVGENIDRALAVIAELFPYVCFCDEEDETKIECVTFTGNAEKVYEDLENYLYDLGSEESTNETSPEIKDTSLSEQADTINTSIEEEEPSFWQKHKGKLITFICLLCGALSLLIRNHKSNTNIAVSTPAVDSVSVDMATADDIADSVEVYDGEIAEAEDIDDTSFSDDSGAPSTPECTVSGDISGYGHYELVIHDSWGEICPGIPGKEGQLNDIDYNSSTGELNMNAYTESGDYCGAYTGYLTMSNGLYIYEGSFTNASGKERSFVMTSR